MNGYLGSFPVDISETKYKDYTPDDWALKFIWMFGQIDGAHHKQWVLDQVARILNGAPVIVSERRWENGYTEFDYEVGTSEKYQNWVKEYEGEDEDGDPEYSYDEGIAP